MTLGSIRLADARLGQEVATAVLEDSIDVCIICPFIKELVECRGISLKGKGELP